MDNKIVLNNDYTEFEQSELNGSIVKRFEKQVEKYFYNPAIKTKDNLLTYGELNKKANCVANLMFDKYNDHMLKTSSSTVAILFEHDIDMIIGILGVLKLGKIYVPLDPTYPEDRLSYILKDSEVSFILTNSRYHQLANKLRNIVNKDMRVVNIDNADINMNYENINIDIDPQQIAYILYTSGSTGRPKGVVQSHRNVLYFIKNYTNNLHINVLDKITLLSSYSCDAAVMDIFGALLNGALLYPFDIKNNGGIESLVNCVIEEEITIYHSIPTVYRYFISEISKRGIKSKVRLVVMGGEPVIKKDVESYKAYFDKNCIFINGLGPTESTVTLQYFIDHETEIAKDVVPVGYPVGDTIVYLVNNQGEEARIFEEGEIVLKSDYLALGYWNMPKETKEAFTEDPISGSGRVYRSGDIGRMLPNGCIEFVARKDFQIKIRGYRVELGEIEAVISDIQKINMCAVSAFEKSNGDKYIVAYYTVKNGEELIVENIRKYLSKKLPEYSIPSFVIQLDEMPLTQNGKIDRKALPEPDEKINTELEYVAPTNDTEERLVKLWKEVLTLEKIGIKDNFFEIGGHSLKATILVSKIHKEFNVEISLKEVFNRPTIREFSKYISNASKDKYLEFEPVAQSEHYPVSSAQKRMYIVNMIDGGGIEYNMPKAIIIEGKLDIERMKNVFNQLIQRHESLRTCFETIDNDIVQKVHKSVEFNVKCIKATEEELPSLAKKFIRPFDLSKATLIRAMLVTIEENKNILLLDMHHIISDGTSISILLKEFSLIYARKNVETLKIQYKDYAVWQNHMYRSQEMRKQEKYWLSIFKGEIPILNMPVDYQRTKIQNFEGDKIVFKIDRELTIKLNAIASKTGTTIYMVLLAAYNILLFRYTGQEDIVVGCPLAGRQHLDLQNVIGMFVNTLAIRNYPRHQSSFEEFLLVLKENVLNAFENQDYPFEELVNRLNISRDISRTPLFDTMFVLQNINNEEIIMDNLNFKPYEIEDSISKFDLSLIAVEIEDGINFNFQYRTKLYKKETIQRLAVHFLNILTQITNNIKIKLDNIDLISKNEKEQLLVDFNNTKTEYAKNMTIHEIFEKQVERTPDNIAVVFENKQLTYIELNRRANQLARVLRKKGVRADTIVGIMVERSIEMSIGIFAILKSGGAYLPISLDYPKKRLEYILEDSKVNILLTQSNMLDVLDFKGEMIEIEKEDIYKGNSSNLERVNNSNDLAYVIYTSGSTGNPKGVMIEHYSVINRINWMQKQYCIGENDVILQKTPFTFDVSVWELFWWSFVGARVCFLIQGGEKDAKTITEVIKKNKITMIHFVPSMLNIFLEYVESLDDLKSVSYLKFVFSSGEILNIQQVEKFNKLLNMSNETKLINLYGPTEATVDVSYFNCSTREQLDVIPIGKPIDNIKLYIISKSKKLQPIGVVGELCIAGDGLARGYLNKIELTEEKFIQNPFAIGERMYKTGDLARWLPNGNIEFIGRTDDQVKIRGFRIELGEIEVQLLKMEEIKGAVVVVTEDEQANKYLCAYIVSKTEVSVAMLREHLLRLIPEYMIPSYFIKIDKIPLTQNGKLDRKELPKICKSINTGIEFIAPTNDIEERLVKLWKEILPLENISIEDRFFEIGGDSLKIIHLASRIYEEFEVEISYKTLYDFTSIKKIAEIIINEMSSKNTKDLGNNLDINTLSLLNKKGDKNIFAFPPIATYGLAYKNVANLLDEYSLYAFNYIEDKKKIFKYINEIIKVQNQGPYILMGYSVGGVLAFEVAKELLLEGYQISALIMIDSYPSHTFNMNEDIEYETEQILQIAQNAGITNINKLMGNNLASQILKRKIINYKQFLLSDEIFKEKVDADIYLIKSVESNDVILDKWSDLTSKRFIKCSGYGKHLEMIGIDFVEKNIQVIKTILCELN